MLRTKSSRVLLAIALLLSITFFFACTKKVDDEAKKGIKIGAILPLTGPISMIGEWHKNGIDYFQQYSKDLKISYVDSEGKPQKAISGLNLIKDDIDGVIGTLSSVMISVIKSTNIGKPIFLVNVSSPNVTMLADNVYRYNIDVVDEVDILLKKMKDDMVKQIGILYINDEYGLSANEFFKKNSVEHSIEIKFSDSFERNQMDFKDITSGIAGQDFPIVVFGYGRPYISLIKAIAEGNYKNVLYTDYSMFIKEFRKPLIGCGLKVFYISPRIKEESFSAWSETYANKNKTEPNYAACVSFDVINIMSHVLNDGQPLLKMNLKNYLEKNEIYSVYGYRIIADTQGEIKVPLQVTEETL